MKLSYPTYKKLVERNSILKEQLQLIESLVDKIRYAGDETVERKYVQKLLNLFDPESGDVK